MLFLLFFKKNVEVPNGVKSGFIGSFGFLPEGEYSFTFDPLPKSTDPETIVLSFLTKTEYRKLPFYNTESTNRCDVKLANLSYPIEIKNESVNLEGVFKDEHIYIFHVLKCNSTREITLSEQFRNKNTFLDSRVIPCKTIYPICIAATLLLFSFWTVFNNIKSRASGTIFMFTTICGCVYAFHLTGEYIAIKFGEKTDSTLSVFVITTIIDVFNDSIYFTLIMLMCSGFGLITISLSLFAKIKAILIPLFLFSFAAISSNIPTKYLIFTYPVVIICTVVFGYDIINLIHHGEKRVMAHMLVVQRTGIDPDTTPIGARYKIFRQMTLYVSAAISLFCLMLILEACYDLDRYLFEIIDFVVHFALLSALLYIYRPGKADYLADESNIAETFDLDDLDSVGNTLRLTANNETMRRWEPGEALPKEPTYTRKKKANDGQLYSAL